MAVVGSEKGLAAYQAEVLELTAGIGNHKEVASVERERLVSIVDDVFQHVPEDTVLGKLSSELKDEVRAVFSRRKKKVQETPTPSPSNEIVLDKEDIPGPTKRAEKLLRNKYVTTAIASTLFLALGTSGAEAIPSDCGIGVLKVIDSSHNQRYTVPANAAQPRATRELGIYIPQMQYPFDPSVITDRFGWRVKPCDSCSANHEGVDFNPGYGAEVTSVMYGTVIEAEYSGSLGVHVYIDDGYGMITMYGHMIDGSIAVNVGDKVSRGQKLGKVGSTGSSTGPHLHFGIKLDGEMVDPLVILNRYPLR
jgi:murein DD-endopeptidase MepM/ murein hydrolase activator NlpD